QERAVLATIYAWLPRDKEVVLTSQLDSLEVTATWAAGSASVEIRPAWGSGTAVADIPDGVLPVRAIVTVGAEVAGEVLIWMDRGVPSGIEYAYYLGDTPSELPVPVQISFI